MISSEIDFDMVLSAYCKQRIVQLHIERRISCERVAQFLAAEGRWVPKQTVWATIRKYKAHGTISRFPVSGRPFKLTRKMREVIEVKMKQDDETTGT